MVLTSKPTVVVSNKPVEIFEISSGRYLLMTNSVTVSTASTWTVDWTVSIGERSVVTFKVDSVFDDTE